MAKTFDQFLKKLITMHGDVYDILSPYKNMETKISVSHKVCGYQWDILPSNLTSVNCIGKTICPECNGKVKYTPEEWSEKIHNLTNGEYKVLGQYKNSYTKILMKHLDGCGFEWETIPRNFLTGRRCLKCSGKMPWPTEEYKKKIEEITNGDYIVLGEYVNNTKDIIMKHLSYGLEFDMSPSNFLYCGSRCPDCTSRLSLGELRIKEYLEKHNILYISEYTFQDCRNINVLPFDFAIFDKKNDILMLIEFDGKQHYEPIDFFGGDESFQQQKLRDEIKNTYCKINGFNLLRIPYWDYENIELILNDKVLSQRNLKVVNSMVI